MAESLNSSYHAHSPFRLIDEELQFISYESELRVGVNIGELELLK